MHDGDTVVRDQPPPAERIAQPVLPGLCVTTDVGGNVHFPGVHLLRQPCHLESHITATQYECSTLFSAMSFLRSKR